ncbi:hypothetical protein [Geothrix sp. PMB-07]|uniref:8-oxoguanine DNA glycosylase n=1 Tax=Geothrix sp. PMB-07 TaxID=3068640 RepID=UPI0027429165|nr:hypothetical protein [Geothrix sp. PMB-07]WLT30926.1 hypothetical protein Q9293_14510 [Geothrix sp. PMB-07]
MQRISASVNGERLEKWLPDADEEVMPGVPWGQSHVLFTPAFWAACAWQQKSRPSHPPNYRTGETLLEEVVFCLLSGHGVSAEMARAAFDHLKQHGVFHMTPTEEEVSDLLRQRHSCGDRKMRYRFPNRRGAYIAEAIRAIHQKMPLPIGGHELRDWLMTLPGVGPKTASFIVRNWCDCDDVAVIDIHIQRAGVAAGVFEKNMLPERHYFAMERRFLAFATALGEKASLLDLLMWSCMRSAGTLAFL